MALALLISVQVAQAQNLEVRPDAATTYVVKRGDTLWDIAALYLKEPWRWKQLWQGNPQIANPNLIYPGDVLRLVWVDGQPRLVREGDPAPPAAAEPDFAAAPEPLDDTAPTSVDGRLQPSVRRSDIASALPTIRIEAIRAFLNGPRVLDSASWDEAPYLVAFEDNRLLGSANQEAYVRRADLTQGRSYQIVHRGQVYRDPETRKILGYEVIPVGDYRLDDGGDPARGEIIRSQREAQRGDRLVPAFADLQLDDFFPQPPPDDVRGTLIAVFDGVSEIGQYQIVAINRGSAHGLQRGHVLGVAQAGRTARDPVAGGTVTLPDVRAGLLMVFATREQLSYGLVLRATRSLHVGDAITPPTL